MRTRSPSRRVAVAVAVGAALLAGASGCGGSGPSDQAQVRTTVTTFARASAAKDYRRICREVLSATLVERIQRAGLTCGEVLAAGLQGVSDPQVKVGAVKVDGDRATARVRSAAAGQAPSEDTMRLVREKGGWRIASLGR